MISQILGINYNYNGSGANPAVDLKFLRNLGFTSVRLLIVDYTLPSTMVDWENIVHIALNYNFTEVMYGLSTYPGGAPITSSNFNTFQQTVLDKARVLAQINDSRLTFEIGNEEDEHVDGTTLTVEQFQTKLVQLSNTVKRLYPNMPLSYSVNQNHVYSWLSLPNIGSFDKIGGNLYDTLSNFSFFIQTLYPPLPNFNKFIITEWNSSNGYNDFNNEVTFAANIAARLAAIKATTIPTAYVYNFMESNNQFGMKNTGTGVFRQAWQGLTQPSNQNPFSIKLVERF